MPTKEKKTNKLLWYWTRLSTMNVAEVLFRVKGLIRNRYEKRFRTNYFPSLKLASYPKPILHLPLLTQHFNTKFYNIFGTALDFESPIDWHYDIRSKSRYPLQFSRSIDTRTEQHGIVKVVWEVNRMQFLTQLCLQYRYSKEEEYLKRFVAIIESWKEQNPYLLGVNWYSNIEISTRIITWLLCWELIEANQLIEKDESFKSFVEETWIPLISLHHTYSHTHPSKFSSANNHLIAEVAGMFIAGVYWDLPETKKHTVEAQCILEREMLLQHSDNGINKEEASEYIQFITDFFLIAYIVGERKGYPFSEEYRAMLKKICYYIFQLMDASCTVPYYGDDDDGHAFVLKNADSCSNFQSLLITGAILFDDPVLKSKAGAFDLKNEILFGEEGRKKFEALATQTVQPTSQFYTEEGHFIIKDGNEKEEIYLHIDAAPLGYLSIAAHGHADALSFFLHIDGVPFIADVGTYTYHSEPDWRAYFKGTLAHNTIRVDGHDQSQNGGPCLWSEHYQSEVLDYGEDEERVFVKIRHTGYVKVHVFHERKYVFYKNRKTVTVFDTISVSDSEEHVYEIPFHLHPSISITPTDSNSYLLSHQHSRQLEITIDSQLSPQLVFGNENPILGWYAPSFLQREKTTTIYSKIEKKGSFQLTTTLKIIP